MASATGEASSMGATSSRGVGEDCVLGRASSAAGVSGTDSGTLSLASSCSSATAGLGAAAASSSTGLASGVGADGAAAAGTSEAASLPSSGACGMFR